MFQDRPYLRAGRYQPPRSIAVSLLIVNAVVFLATCVAYQFPSAFSLTGFPLPADSWFALNLGDEFRHFHLWQLFTYQFLHGSVIHLLLNSWAIYSFGREVEEAVGKKSFLLLYLFSGLVGGLVQLGAAVVAPEHFGHPVVGASACAFGLVAVFATLYPERPLTLLLFYIVPVSLRAKYLLVIAAALALFGIAFPFDNVAHAAHLGGLLTGMAFVKYVLRDLNPEVLLRPPQHNAPPPQATLTFVTAKPPPSPEEITEAPAELDTTEFMRRQVDPILDKIHAHGLHSLNAHERNVLEQARQRMSEE